MVNNDNFLFSNSTIYSQINDTYPQLTKLGEPVFAANAYYPIAVLEFDMDELVFEDFEPIEKMILQCVKYEIIDENDISNFIGLPIRYVRIHLQDLENKNQIRDGKLTELGEQSLQSGLLTQKLNNSKQNFPADGILGFLLPSSYYLSKNRQRSRQETNPAIMHLKYCDEIDAEILCKQLKGDNLINKYRRKILNTNVNNINDISLNDFYYIPVFVLWFNSFQNPVIFFSTKNSNSSNQETANQFIYKPLYVPKDVQPILNLKDIHIAEENTLIEIQENCLIYANESVPAEKDIQSFFRKRPYIKVANYDFHQSNNGVRTCHIQLEGGSGFIDPKSLDFLASLGGDPYPHTFMLENYSDTKLISFATEIIDKELKILIDELYKRWRSDRQNLKEMYNSLTGKQIHSELKETLKMLLEI